MSQFQLTISFSDADLDTLATAGEQVVIAKMVFPQEESNRPVAWVTFRPFSLNTITWTESYGVYASSVLSVQGNQVVKVSETAAYGGESYTLVDAGHFTGPHVSNPGMPALTDNQYQVVNNWSDPTSPVLSFGLTQSLTLNGRDMPEHPLNAEEVPYGQSGTFAPQTNILVYMASDITTGTVLGEATSQETTLSFGEATSIAVMYSHGRFLQQT